MGLANQWKACDDDDFDDCDDFDDFDDFQGFDDFDKLDDFHRWVRQKPINGWRTSHRNTAMVMMHIAQ